MKYVVIEVAGSKVMGVTIHPSQVHANAYAAKLASENMTMTEAEAREVINVHSFIQEGDWCLYVEEAREM